MGFGVTRMSSIWPGCNGDGQSFVASWNLANSGGGERASQLPWVWYGYGALQALHGKRVTLFYKLKILIQWMHCKRHFFNYSEPPLKHVSRFPHAQHMASLRQHTTLLQSRTVQPSYTSPTCNKSTPAYRYSKKTIIFSPSRCRTESYI